MARVVVVGAGIAGAAAAYALRSHAVTVIEGASAVGGKLRTSEFAGALLDEGAEQFLVRAPEASELVRALGLDAQLVHPQATRPAVWSRGWLHPLPARTMLGVPSSVQSLIGLLQLSEVARAAVDLVAPGKVPQSDVAVGGYLRRRLGDAVVDRLVDPLLGGVYAGRADELSLFATIPGLRGASSASVVRAARESLGTATGDDPVFATLTGGLGQLVPATLAASGAEVVTGRMVRRIERLPVAGFRVVHGPTIDEQALDADAVVVAVPAAPAARLLSDIAPVAAAELGGIDYASVAIVSLAYAQPLPGEWTGFLVPAVEGRAVKAATFSSLKWAHVAGGVVRCSLGRAGEVALLQRSDEELISLAAADISAMAGFPAPVESRITRWGGGLPQYAVGHLDRVSRIRAAVAAVPGLAVCGAAYDGVGVPACIRSGYAAATQVTAI